MQRIALLLAAVVLVTSCKQQGRPEGTLHPAKGGKYHGGVFRVNENGDLSSLDPVAINDVTSAHIAENIYDNLLSFDEHLELVPELAKSWTVSEDGRTYTYHLHDDVYFHDDPCFPGGKGRKMTAHDVKYSLSRACDFRAKTKSYDYFRGKVDGADEYYESTHKAFEQGGEPGVRGVRGFVVVDDTTFSIHLVKPFAPFRHYVALTSMGIHAHEAVEHYGANFFKNPVGTGPFEFVSWSDGRDLKLVANRKYWKYDDAGNRLPLLEAVRFTFMKDDKMQLLEFQAGNLEESYRIANEFFGDIVDENKKPKGKYAKYNLLHATAASTQFYGFLTTDPVLRDKRIRQAFNLAIDRRRIIRYVLRGQAAGPAEHGFVPPTMPGYHTDSVRGYSFDPVRAKRLLAEAGYPDGKGLPEITLQLNAGGGRNISIAEAIQGMLKENLNVSIGLRQIEFAQHLQSIDEGKAPFFRLGWVADYPDPETFLNLYYGKLVPKDGGISPINSVRYQNPKFDALFEQALATTDEAKRMELYRQAEQIAIDDAPMLLIFHDEDYRFIQPYVMDYRNNAMDKRPYKYVWFDPSKMPQ